MTEEEKKAIEYLKRHIIPCYENKGRIEFMLNDTLLNLIEKLQKENEDWKERARIAEENDTTLVLDVNQACKELGISEDTIIADELPNKIREKYILKDKIREKLEKIEKEKEQYYAAGQHLMYMLLKNQLKSLIEED